MLSAQNSQARRSALRAYGLSRTSDLTSLNEIVDLAVRLCGVSAGFLSIIDENTQYYVIRVGFDIEALPIEETICAQVMQPDGVTVVADTQADPRLEKIKVCHGDGAMRFYASAPLLTRHGRSFGTLSVMNDAPHELTSAQIDMLAVLSRQVVAQLDLRRALGRASVMRREVDHRVKNSLQSVSSLTRMQSRRVQSAEAREALEVVSRRIDTVAALNSQLYRTGTDRKVKLNDFLGSVVDLIRASAPEAVTIDHSIDDVNISASHAGSLAIVINEFTTNSFKHAFPDGREGHIEITARQVSPGLLHVDCRDDGVGIGTGSDGTGTGLGNAIIDSAVDSLDGEIERNIDGPGYSIRVSFDI